jgi:outer membrane protein assembly factor BamB
MTTPTVAGDRVLVGGFDNKLFAVDVASGELDWIYEVENWILSSVRVLDGVAYFGDFDSILHAVDVETGTAEWSFNLDRGKIRGAVAVVDDFIVVGTDDDWLVGLDRGTQQRIWERDIGTPLRSDLVAFEDEVLLAPDDCVTPGESDLQTYYRAVDPETGTLAGVSEVC